MFHSAFFASRTARALISAFFAIVLNMLLLKAADLIPLATAHGGLLRLVGPVLGEVLTRLGVAGAWRELGGPAPDSPMFQGGFHFVVGLLMAIPYAWLDDRWQAPPWFKGFCYGLIVWLLNACVVLPATGEGFAGRAHLTWFGMAWFAVAHWTFFIVMSVLYARSGKRR